MATTKHRSKKSSSGVAARCASRRLRARMGTVTADPRPGRRSARDPHQRDAVALDGEGEIGRAGVAVAADLETDDGGGTLRPYGRHLQGHLAADELGVAPLTDLLGPAELPPPVVDRPVVGE